MNKPVPQFRNIASPLDDISDDALDELAGKLGVPSLVKPEPPPAPEPRPNSQPAVQPPRADMPKPSSRPVGRNPRQTAPLPAKDPQATSLERVSVDLPDYLYRAMRMRVAEEGTTLRYVVMQGLQAIGFAIDPRDFVSDGRSFRSRTG